MGNFLKWDPKKDSTGKWVPVLEMGLPFPVMVNCAFGYLLTYVRTPRCFALRWCAVTTALDSEQREGGYRRVRMTSWLKLTSQTAVITGAASGIGRGMLRNHLFNSSAFMLNDESHLLSKQLLLQPRPLHSRSKGKQLY